MTDIFLEKLQKEPLEVYSFYRYAGQYCLSSPDDQCATCFTEPFCVWQDGNGKYQILKTKTHPKLK